MDTYFHTGKPSHKSQTSFPRSWDSGHTIYSDYSARKEYCTCIMLICLFGNWLAYSGDSVSLSIHVYTEQQKKLYIDSMCIYYFMYINILTKITK